MIVGISLKTDTLRDRVEIFKIKYISRLVSYVKGGLPFFLGRSQIVWITNQQEEAVNLWLQHSNFLPTVL